MAINAYFGKPRQGKSYSCVERVIVPAVKAGRKVVTNIPLTEKLMQLAEESGAQVEVVPRGTTLMLDYASKLFPELGESGEYMPSSEYAGAVFVLDEFQFLLPAGIKQSQIDKKVIAFFTMHGHASGDWCGKKYITEIVLLSQDQSLINQVVKPLIEQSYVVNKTEIGSKSVFNIKVYAGCAGWRNVTFVKTEVHQYDPAIFDYYKTQTMSEGHGSEKKTDDATNVLKSGALKGFAFAVVLLPFAIWFAISTAGNMFGVTEDAVPASKVDADNAEVAPEKAEQPKTSLQPVKQELVEQSRQSIEPAHGVEGNFLDGAKVYFFGSYTVKNRRHDMLMIMTADNKPERVYADDLLRYGYIFEDNQRGMRTLTHGSKTMYVPLYSDSSNRVKPFFAN